MSFCVPLHIFSAGQEDMMYREDCSLSEEHTEVSLALLAASRQRLIAEILEMMDGNPKCRTAIIKCGQYLMC